MRYGLCGSLTMHKIPIEEHIVIEFKKLTKKTRIE